MSTEYTPLPYYILIVLLPLVHYIAHQYIQFIVANYDPINSALILKYKLQDMPLIDHVNNLQQFVGINWIFLKNNKS